MSTARRTLDDRSALDVDDRLSQEARRRKPPPRRRSAARQGPRLPAHRPLRRLRRRSHRRAPRHLPRPRQPPREGHAGRLPRRPQGVLLARLRSHAGRADPAAGNRIARRRALGPRQSKERIQTRRLSIADVGTGSGILADLRRKVPAAMLASPRSTSAPPRSPSPAATPSGTTSPTASRSSKAISSPRCPPTPVSTSSSATRRTFRPPR